MNAYRCRVLRYVQALLRPFGPVKRGLDFGSGDGWFAWQLANRGLVSEIVPLDVKARGRCFRTPLLYSGKTLPFADMSFDLVSCFDSLHHCAEPQKTIKELGRCAAKLLLIKDHVCSNVPGWVVLACLDEAYNRRFGVVSRYRYQWRWEWLRWVQDEGFRLENLVYPAICHKSFIGWVVNRFQFVGLWSRCGA